MKNISTFFYRNEKWLTPTALICGFILDSFTIRRADRLIENVLLGVYFLLLMSSLLIWHTIEAKRTKSVSLNEFQSILFLTIQFIFGGLFSALTVFYIKSASIFASWPFLLLLFGGMIATEYFKKHLTQFLVQLGTLYILLFTYSIVVVPLIVRKINSTIFVLSGILSLIVISLYIILFNKTIPTLIRNKSKYVIAIIASIFVLMNVFYFLNIIPPIPLALREANIYQSVIKQSNRYVFANFPYKFSIMDLKTEYIIQPGTPVYFYSSIFAPIKFEQKIIHEWQKKNQQDDWIKISSVSFLIYGGSNSGYRGYSISELVTKGDWRVLVKTQEGQILGGKSFVVK